MKARISAPTYLTVGDVARNLEAPEWLVRRLADSLGLVRGTLGRYRLLLPQDQEMIQSEIRRRASA